MQAPAVVLAYRPASLDRTPAQLREQLHSDGYLHLPGVLDPAAVRHVREAVIAFADRHGLGRYDPARDRLLANPWEGPDDDVVRRDLQASMVGLESVHRLMHDRELLGVISGLLGTHPGDVLVHPRKALRVMLPELHDGGFREAPGWHQDFHELGGSRLQLTVWTPLFTTEPTSGSLAVAQGAHHDGPRPLQLALGPTGFNVAHPADPEIRCGGIRPSDILVFTTFTPHAGTDNDSDAVRVSVDCRYQPRSEPISASNLELAGLELGWDDIYASWESDDLAWYWRKGPALNVVEHDPRWEQWRDRAALAAGRRRLPVAEAALRLAAGQSRSSAVRSEAGELLRSFYDRPDA